MRGEVQCREIIDWLRVAITRPAIGGVNPLVRDDPLAPVADELLFNHRWGLVL